MELKLDIDGLDFYQDEQGRQYRTGLLPGPAPKLLAGSPTVPFADRFAPIPQEKWADVDLWVIDGNVWDQNPYNSCGGHGAVAAFSLAYHLAGFPQKRFSPTFVYGDVIHRTRRGDSGARLDELLDTVTQSGVCTEDKVGRGQIYRQRWTDIAGAYAEAKLHLAAEWFECMNFDDIGTAHQLGFAVAFGTSIGSAFRPDANGIIPAQRGNGGGHAMASGGVKTFGSQRFLKVKNSWGIPFGVGGYCYMPESYFTDSLIAAYGGAWAGRVATSPDIIKIAA